ncbi:MAG TPA: FmdB family transcriptional regulator [Verrucomicrobiales bacterium]|nr:FmdB family transcriptional regulator [Verrucomicrobiales bacterium]HCN78124.1 FmdB family transcriptional regulator [Verrucomicrobiales bacterium]HRJ08016.1 zinc ribbon domain-containing protein [Prosthecobacter sp.]HRK12659.1 zinc ribbon domain-containing protein [Prosthecobacter sp.]
MPTYSYIAEDPEKGCPSCRRGFDLRRPMSRPALAHCPLCRQPVKKLVSTFNTPVITRPLSVTDAKKAGFTILEKRCDGSYERL